MSSNLEDIVNLMIEEDDDQFDDYTEDSSNDDKIEIPPPSSSSSSLSSTSRKRLANNNDDDDDNDDNVVNDNNNNLSSSTSSFSWINNNNNNNNNQLVVSNVDNNDNDQIKKMRYQSNLNPNAQPFYPKYENCYSLKMFGNNESILFFDIQILKNKAFELSIVCDKFLYPFHSIIGTKENFFNYENPRAIYHQQQQQLQQYQYQQNSQHYNNYRRGGGGGGGAQQNPQQQQQQWFYNNPYNQQQQHQHQQQQQQPKIDDKHMYYALKFLGPMQMSAKKKATIKVSYDKLMRNLPENPVFIVRVNSNKRTEEATKESSLINNKIYYLENILKKYNVPMRVYLCTKNLNRIDDLSNILPTCAVHKFDSKRCSLENVRFMCKYYDYAMDQFVDSVINYDEENKD